MITLDQETALIDKIKSMSEIELELLMEELKPHFIKNDLGHVFEGLYDVDQWKSEIQDLQTEVDELESQLDELREEKSKVFSLIIEADNIDSSGEFAAVEFKLILDKISNIVI